MKRFYSESRKADKFMVGGKLCLEAEHMITGCPKKKLHWQPFHDHPEGISGGLQATATPVSEDTFWLPCVLTPLFPEWGFDRPLPHITLNVRGEDWEPEQCH